MATAIFLAVFSRTWLKIVRRPVVLLLSLVQPLIWMSFFGFLFQRFPVESIRPGISYLDFLLPGVCGMTVLFGASQSGISLIRDFQVGMLDRMLSTAANRSCMLLGKIIADLSRLLVQAILVALLGKLLGARIELSTAMLVGGLYLVLFGAAYCCLSCLIALATRSQESLAAFIHVANMPLLFTSTALVPARQMPSWLQEIAAWNPLTLAIDPLRSALIAGNHEWNLTTLVILCCLTTTLFGLALIVFQNQTVV